MQRLFSMFPPGAPGYGLFVLRIIAALSLHLGATGHLEQNPRILVFTSLLVLSAFIAVGLFTPVVAAIGAAVRLILLIGGAGSPGFASAIAPLSALALILLGPGAHSIDARLFGRKVLVLRDMDR